MRGLPWHMGGKSLDKDAVGANETALGPIQRPGVPAKRKAPGRYVLKLDVDRFGGTQNCPACIGRTLHGKVGHKAGDTHTDECRD